MTIDNSAIGDNAGADEYQVVNGQVEEDSIEQFIEKLNSDWEYPIDVHLGETPTATIDPPQEEEPVEEENEDDSTNADTPDPPDDDAPHHPDTVDVNGVAVPLADVQRLYEFDQYLRSNPEASRRVAQAISNDQPTPATPDAGEPPVPAQATAPTPLEPPDFLDLEDPAQKFLWESHTKTQAELADLNSRTAKAAQSLADRQAVIDTDAAIAQFRAAHANFNDDQILNLRRHAASMNILDSLLATSNTPVEAITRTLDIAALDHEDSRTLYLTPEAPKEKTTTEKSRARKSALNSLSGTSGSVPRQTATPKPQSDREMIDEFAKQLGETFQQS